MYCFVNSFTYRFLEKANHCHSRGSNRESIVFKKQKNLDSRLRTSGMTTQTTRNICKEVLGTGHYRDLWQLSRKNSFLTNLRLRLTIKIMVTLPQMYQQDSANFSKSGERGVSTPYRLPVVPSTCRISVSIFPHPG